MADLQPTQLTASGGEKKKEPVIHTIPPQFLGAAAKAKLPKQAIVAAPAPVLPGAAPGAPVGAPPPAPPSESKKWLLIPIGAVVFLGILGFLAWFFLLRKPAPKAPVSEQPSVTLPTAEPEPEPQPAPEPEPAPTPVEEATSTPPTPEPPKEAPKEPAEAPDTDNDGLSNNEETLYGTNPDKADSDEDGFSDSVELVNLYNPAGFKPTKLLEAGLVTEMTSTEGKYDLLYPTSWSKSDKAGGEVTFTNPQNQPISLSIEENAQGQSVLDWYLSQTPGVSPTDVQPFFTKSGLEGVRSPDGLTAYIDAGGKVYILAYTPGLEATHDFRSTLVMMMNSFRYLP
jgi:outer membrane biosynthesis protein TonB